MGDGRWEMGEGRGERAWASGLRGRAVGGDEDGQLAALYAADSTLAVGGARPRVGWAEIAEVVQTELRLAGRPAGAGAVRWVVDEAAMFIVQVR